MLHPSLPHHFPLYLVRLLLLLLSLAAAAHIVAPALGSSACTRSIMGRFTAGAPVPLAPLSQVFAIFDVDSDGAWAPSDLAALTSDYLDALGDAADADLAHAAAA